MTTREEQILRLGAWFAGEFDGPVDQYAREVYDLLLPEVTTVQQLEALPSGALLLSGREHKMVERRWDVGLFCWQAGGLDYTADGVMMHFAPLTVVWQPAAPMVAER